MKPITFTKVATLTLAVAILTTAGPSYAASAGRISGGSFRSPSGSSSRGSSRSYSSRSSQSYSSQSYGYSAPRIHVAQPSRSNTNIVVIPGMPGFSSSVSRIPEPAQVVSDPVAEAASAQFALGLISFLGVGGLALYLLFGGWSDDIQPLLDSQRKKLGKLTLARIQVALLASARDVQKDLIRMAEEGDTSSSRGLSMILRETSLALLRNSEYLAYSNSDSLRVPIDKAEDYFSKLSMEERSKASDEALSNVSGKVVRKRPLKTKSSERGEYILVSMILATNRDLGLPVAGSVENLRKNLLVLGTVSPEDLIALEIIWQPEDKDEVLSQAELLSLYPNLKHL